MKNTLYHGRPEDVSDRLKKEIACYALLDSLGVSYDRVDHDFADTIEACEAVEQVLGEKICKNLFLCNRQKTSFYLLMMPGEKVFKTKDLSKQLGVAASEHHARLCERAGADERPGKRGAAGHRQARFGRRALRLPSVHQLLDARNCNAGPDAENPSRGPS